MIKEGSCDVTNIPELGAILEVDGKVGIEANESLEKFVEFVIVLVDWFIEKGLICDADFKLELVAALDVEGKDDTAIEEFLEFFGFGNGFWEEICDATCKPDLDTSILGVDGEEIIEDELCEGFVKVSIGAEFVIAIDERAWVWGGITDDLDNGGFIGATNKPETVGIEVLDVEGNDNAVWIFWPSEPWFFDDDDALEDNTKEWFVDNDGFGLALLAWYSVSCMMKCLDTIKELCWWLVLDGAPLWCLEMVWIWMALFNH